MKKLPDAVFILDTKKEHIAVTEANKLGIPIVAVVDTNCDPDVIQYVIPGNDDAIRSGNLMCRIIADAVEEGRFIAARRPAAAPVPAPSPPRRTRRGGGRRSPSSRPRPAARPPPPQAEREARLAAARQKALMEQEAEAAAEPARAERRPPSPPPSPRPPPSRARGRADRRGRRAEAAPAEPRPPPPPRPTPSHRDPPRRADPAMAEFTAKDVQALRQATGAGMMDAKKALAGERRRLRGRRKWLREKGLAKSADRGRPRERRGRRRRRASTATSPPSSSSSARPTSSPSPTTSSPLVQALADAVAADGEGAVAALKDRVDDLKVTLKENIEVGRVVRFEAGRGQRPRHLPAHAGRPRQGRASSSSSPAARRSWPTTSPSTSPSPSRRSCQPRRGPGRRGRRRGARDAHDHHPQRGQARGGADEDRRGPLNGWYKERVLLEQKFVQRREADRSPSCSAGPASSASP